MRPPGAPRSAWRLFATGTCWSATLGQGGIATVWLARDLKHDRPVALKVFRPELGAVVGAERFVRGLRLTAMLSTPVTLPLLDSGKAAGRWALPERLRCGA